MSKGFLNIIQRPHIIGGTSQIRNEELGFSYQDADKVLRHHFDEHLSIEDMIAKGVPRELVVNVLERVQRADFKHHVPYCFGDVSE